MSGVMVTLEDRRADENIIKIINLGGNKRFSK
jgi:hypothetical protein